MKILMQLNINHKTLEKITKGILCQAAEQEILYSLSYDTRTLQKGQAYIALKGANFDGHTFINKAVEAGASLIILEKSQASKYTKILNDIPYLEVNNTLFALQEIAKFHRLNKNIKIAAVTGSNGKSTTKQMLASILRQAGQTCSTEGNLNNQIGVPRSLLEITDKDDYGVFELGASHKGDIAEIARLVLPDVAVITNISPSHLEFFGSMENIYKTKTEILQYLNKDATLVFNGDDKFLKLLRTAYKGKMISFGFTAGNDIQIQDSPTFSFVYKGDLFNTGVMLEKHNKLNAAAACGAVLSIGILKKDVENGLKNYQPMPMRLEKHKLNKSNVLLDCYNANPVSMENALNILASYKGYKTAVLGDMRELGKYSQKYHKELAKQIIEAKIDSVFLAGKETEITYKELLKLNYPAVKYSLNKLDFLSDLNEITKKPSLILFKASRSLNFEDLFLKLKEIK